MGHLDQSRNAHIKHCSWVYLQAFLDEMNIRIGRMSPGDPDGGRHRLNLLRVSTEEHVERRILPLSSCIIASVEILHLLLPLNGICSTDSCFSGLWTQD